MVVADKIVLELKAVQALNAAHIAQAHHYLAATGLRLAICSISAAKLETKAGCQIDGPHPAAGPTTYSNSCNS